MDIVGRDRWGRSRITSDRVPGWPATPSTAAPFYAGSTYYFAFYHILLHNTEFETDMIVQ